MRSNESYCVEVIWKGSSKKRKCVRLLTLIILTLTIQDKIQDKINILKYGFGDRTLRYFRITLDGLHYITSSDISNVGEAYYVHVRPQQKIQIISYIDYYHFEIYDFSLYIPYVCCDKYVYYQNNSVYVRYI